MEIQNPAQCSFGAPIPLLAALGGVRPAAPDWYAPLDSDPPEPGFIEVEGARIEYYTWGQSGRPGVLLLHGSRAHARWWGPVAPLLAQAGYRVACMSFSGHGGSGWRESYHMDQHGAEMFAVATAAGLDRDGARFFIGAHSFGGLIAICAIAGHEARLAGMLLLDCALTPVELEPTANLPRALRAYPSQAAALARFCLAPPQSCDNLYLVDDIARQALIEEGGSWRWRFDPIYIEKLVRGDSWAAVAATATRLAVIYGELSVIVTGERLRLCHAQAPKGTPFIAIPQAGHHVMLDQPLALAAAIRAVLGCWQQEFKTGGNND